MIIILIKDRMGTEMNAAILYPPSLRSPFGKSIAIHAALGTLILGCMLWSALSSRNSVLDAPVSLELHSAKPSQESAIRQTKKMVHSPGLVKHTDSLASPENSVSATQAGTSEEAMGSTRTTYLSELRNFIERNKSYPPQARTLGHEGQAEIRFSILSDGTLSSIELLRSSGSSILDQAALSLLQRVQKLSPIPAELKLSQLDLVLPIQYSLN